MSGKGQDDSESGGGATKPPSPTEPSKPSSGLGPGPIDPVLLPLLEGVGLSARPPSAVLLQAREALRRGTATTDDLEVLLQEAVSDARDLVVAASVAKGKSIKSPSWDVMCLACGPGRDVSAASLAGMAAESAQALRIDRFQAVRVFGEESYNHAFGVVTFSDGTKYLVDPTFAQFQAKFATAADVTFATDLVRDGFVRLDDVNGALYASHLRRAELAPASAAESSALASRLHTGEWADKVETVGAGRPGLMLHEPSPPESMLNVLSREEMLEDAVHTRQRLLLQDDPQGLAQAMEWLINRIEAPESLP
jgi:hypothetical protein